MDRTVAHVLSARLGGDWTVRALGGSAFCSTWRAQSAHRATARNLLFVKSGPRAQANVLEAEADGLAALTAAGCIRSPELLGCWTDESLDLVVLAMEWLDLASTPAPQFGELFGRQLAALHRMPAEQGKARFGWHRDNWLGGTPQQNRWSERDGLEGWLAFFAEERLGAMAGKLVRAGAVSSLVDAIQRVIDALPDFFADHHVPRPSLIHGDLWSGNWGCMHDGAPVIYDPAVSLSDAEAELAMTELFGSPPRGFWDAYRAVAPIAEGYVHRRNLYQLYHLLNHALLFGGGYVQQAMRVMEALLTAR